MLQAGDTLVIYKPDRVARSMKELLVLLEDQLHARGINLHILTGICAGIHRPDGAAIADKMLFMVAAMTAAMERDLIRERTPLRAAPMTSSSCPVDRSSARRCTYWYAAPAPTGRNAPRAGRSARFVSRRPTGRLPWRQRSPQDRNLSQGDDHGAAVLTR